MLIKDKVQCGVTQIPGVKSRVADTGGRSGTSQLGEPWARCLTSLGNGFLGIDFSFRQLN